MFVKIVNSIKMLVALPIGLLIRKRLGNVWIITERPDQARDNGYSFFKYMCKKHPEQPVYYIIKKDAHDYEKLVQYKKVISFDSWKHRFFFCASTVHISAHVKGCNPLKTPIIWRIKKQIGYKDVFLPHGVSYGISEFCLAKYSGIDLFICSGKPEYDNVVKHYGYTKDQVVYTGFPRLDEWHDMKVNFNQLVLMPTWRLYLAQNPDTVFKETTYFQTYDSLLNSAELAMFLKENCLQLVFYLHHEMRKYVEYFKTKCTNIEVVYNDDTYDLQQLLKSSALLITDYSSVHFDFAYMGKPVLYYQFDYEDFWQKQYAQSDYNVLKDGFGPVAYDQKTLLDNLKQAYKNGFRMQGIYEQRMKEYYLLHDSHNCDRVYAEIKNRFG